MTKRPAFQFYPGDWQRAPELRCCSIGARGCWLEMICIMHQAQPYGYLVINGSPIKPDTLARMIGASPREVTVWLQELEQAGVFDRDEEGCIVSRRMVRDEAVRNARASGGKLGGNPNLTQKPKVTTKVGDKVNLPANLKTTPSSSSSSSSSDTLSLSQACVLIPDEVSQAWNSWKRHLRENHCDLKATSEEFAYMALSRAFPGVEEQVEVIRFSIERKAMNLILTGDHRRQQQASAPKSGQNKHLFSKIED